MKLTLLAITVFSFVVGAANSATINLEPTLSVTRRDSSSVYLINYLGAKTGTVTLTIKDERSNLIVKKSIQNQRDFVLPINFSSVSEGIYVIQIDNGDEKRIVIVNYNNDTAPTYSHVSSLGDGRYLFSSSHSGSEKISIKIYDGNDNLVFNEHRLINGNFATIYNLTNVPGQPYFEVSGTSGNSLMVPGNLTVTEVNDIKNDLR
ncbi:MAG TPA: hypothetical protein VFW11_09935 [Cyclobacteriaceae bacterium]|nr:hypothetical protein [Cyclobacteriaceae bacterium]